MLTGRRLFKGKSISDILAAVLTNELNLEELPARIRTLVKRCLDRDRKTRLRDIGEARVMLARPPGEAPASANRLLVPALAAALFVCAGIIAWLAASAPQPRLPVRRFSFAPGALGAQAGFPMWNVVISPNGKRIAHVADRKLWIRELDREESRPLEGTDGVLSPFWSPDSDTIGFVTSSEIKKVPLPSGTVLSLATVKAAINGAAWSPDGGSIVVTSSSGLLEVSAAGGPPRTIVDLEKLGGPFSSPQFLPAGNGTRILLLSIGTTTNAQQLTVLNLKTGEKSILGPGSFPAFADSGHIIYRNFAHGASGGLWALPFSLNTLAASGDPIPLEAGATEGSVSGDGTLVFVTNVVNRSAQLVLRDRSGKQLRLAGVPQQDMTDLAVSPDGTRVAVSATEHGNQDVWIHDLDRSIKSRLTFDPSIDRFPKWSPDGKSIAFSSAPKGPFDLYLKASDGSGEPVLIDASPTPKILGDWSSDGRHLVVVAAGKGYYDLVGYKRKQDGGGFEQFEFLATQFQEVSPRISPGGRFVAYNSNETGRNEIFVRPFPQGEGKWQISTNGASQARWSRDGKEVYFIEGNTLIAVPVTTSPTFTAGRAKTLFQSPGLSSDLSVPMYDTVPGGNFLIIEPVNSPDQKPPAIHVVQNWLEAYRGRRGVKPE
jgi:serine/threonine-protein kinase